MGTLAIDDCLYYMEKILMQTCYHQGDLIYFAVSHLYIYASHDRNKNHPHSCWFWFKQTQIFRFQKCLLEACGIFRNYWSYSLGMKSDYILISGSFEDL